MLVARLALITLLLTPALSLAAPELQPTEAQLRNELAKEQGWTSPLVVVEQRARDGRATRVTIDLVQQDAASVLRALARVSGAQLVLTDELPSPQVTMQVKDVTAQHAFYSLLTTIGGVVQSSPPLLFVGTTSPASGPSYDWPHGAAWYQPPVTPPEYIGCW